MARRPSELEEVLAPISLERARALGPLVLGGILISVITSELVGVPLHGPVIAWNVVAVAIMSVLVFALRRDLLRAKHGHIACGIVWVVPIVGTFISYAFTGQEVLTYLLCIEMVAGAILLQQRWLIVTFAIVDLAWLPIALTWSGRTALFATMLLTSQLVASMFLRVYRAQLLRAEGHRREQAAQLAELQQSEQKRRQLHEQLVHAQRMEAVGTLSAGLAHDMNNILGSIVSFAELARDEARSLPAVAADLDRILGQAQRGAELTRGLLAFSRRGQYRKRVIVLDTLVAQLVEILGRTLPKTITLRTELGANTARVDGDPAQLEQVVVNLAVNATDAMSGTGVITLRTSVVDGRARIEIADTGAGMDEQTRLRIFEPFFTTKPLGKGTGLGLSTVWGIVTGHGGSVSVASTLGAGTTFTIELPTTSARATTARFESTAPPPIAERARKVLVVDDEPLVRNGTRRILERKGYAILEAANGAEALDLFDAHAAEIGLVVLDMAMPVMGGPECFDRLRERGNVPVLVTTGHTSDSEAQHLTTRGAALLEKPFASSDLVREASRLLARA